MMEDDHLKYKTNKLCGICGDKALGYNFNAITCEACKAFFRRNALRTKDFKCPFDGSCKIDLVTRRFCQKCRLKKCFDIGMKKEWILSEEEKRVKRDKILENRRKKELSSTSLSSGSSIHHLMNGNSDDDMMMSMTSQDSNHSDNTSSNHSFVNDTMNNNNNNNNSNNKTLMNMPGNRNSITTHHQPPRAMNLDFPENSHHHNNRNNQKENFFNSLYLFEHQKYQQNLYLSSKFFPRTEKPYPTSRFPNNIKSSSNQSYQHHYTHHHPLPPQPHYHQYHHYQQQQQQQQPQLQPQPPPQSHPHPHPQSQLLPQNQLQPQLHSSYEKSISPTQTASISVSRPLSLTMKTNFQGSLPSPSLCNINGKNNNNNNNHRNIDIDHLNIKTEYNELSQTTNHTSQIDPQGFTLKTEPDEYISPLKHMPTSPTIIDNNHNQYVKRVRCQSDCQSNSVTDRSFNSSDESESANTVFSAYNNSSDIENFKEISGSVPQVILQPGNICKEDASSSSTSPFNDKSSITLPEEKSGLNGANKYEDIMMNGQSTGNQISIFHLNLSAMAPESISESYNYIETYRLEELTDACKHLNRWSHNGSIWYEMRHLKEIYQVAEHVFQHFISMAKMITAFNDLCETDQISLLKYSVTEILILRSVSCFLPNKDAWIFNLDNNEKGSLLQFNTCKTQIPDSEFNDDIRHFILAMPEKCRNDRYLFDLATMVVLFNPNCLDLKHKDVVRLEHITYCHLLCKYIHINYSSSSSSSMEKNDTKAIHFNTMLNLIDQLHKINRKISNVLPFRIITEVYDKRNLAQA